MKQWNNLNVLINYLMAFVKLMLQHSSERCDRGGHPGPNRQDDFDSLVEVSLGILSTSP